MPRRRPTTFSEVIQLWESRYDLADDLGVSYSTVASWKRRNSIPASLYNPLIASANKRGIGGITLDLLHQIAREGAEERKNNAA